MTGLSHPSRDSGEPFSSNVTRKIVQDAQGVFDEVIDPDALTSHLDEIIAAADDLQEHERRQLTEIARLLQAQPNAAHVKVQRDGEFILHASKDRMTLELTVHPAIAAGQPVTVEDVLQALRQQDIRRGVDLSAIKQAVEAAAEDGAGRPVVIVRGQPPQPGVPDAWRCYARRTMDGPLEKVPDNLMGGPTPLTPWLCREGDRVVEYVPETPGAPGYDALGQVLEPEASTSTSFRAGDNLRSEEVGYIATVSGVVVFTPHGAEVRKAMVINRDLTRQQGLVEFDGEVQIHGAVRSGARLRATGNIRVDGPVEAASIESTRGDVRLSHGVAGRHTAVIRAQHDIVTRFAENATLFAGNDIVIENGCMHCHLTAGHAIKAVRGKGTIVGGVAMAGLLIEVRYLGTRSAVATKVSVGLSRQVMEKVGHIDDLVGRLTQRQRQACELAERMQRVVGDPAKLTAPELKTYTQLRQLQLFCEIQTRKLALQRQQVLAEAADEHQGRIDVTGRLMSNTEIRIGSAVLDLDETLERCRICWDAQAQRITIKRLV